jgi:radical SAM superfamily enzyme YgiQ (UPF0313 family)
MKILMINVFLRRKQEFNSEDDGLLNIGLHYLGAVLKKKHEVRYASFTQYTDEPAFHRVLKDFNPVVTCISFCSEGLTLAVKCAGWARAFGCHTIGGGVHFNLSPTDQGSDFDAFDVVFRGESELLLEEYIDNHRWLKGKVFKASPVKKLDALPFLDLEDWFANYHDNPDKGDMSFPFEMQGTPFLAARGCPGRCLFCGNYRRPYRHRSPENIVEEFKLRIRENNARMIVFFDITFTVDRKFILDLMRAIKKADLGIYFECGTRADYIDDEMLEAMKEAGCLRVMFGMESFDDNLLAFTGKGTTAEINYRAAELLQKYDIPLKANFLVGIPGETHNHYDTLEDFIRRFKPIAFNFYVFRPHLYTPLYEMTVNDRYLLFDAGDYKRAYTNGEITEYAVQEGMGVKLFKDVDYDKLWKWRREMSDKYIPKGPYDVRAYKT